VPSGTQYRLVICPLNNCEFEMRLFEPKSPLPGNGISRAETKAPRRTRRFKDATAEEGSFLAYGPHVVPISRELLARQLVKLLHGTKPADLPPNSNW
jgi:hypothetical protein